MVSIERNTETERRLFELEQAVRALQSELADIRQIISSGYDVLFEANDNRSKEIQTVARHIEQIEDRLEPVFEKTFPEQANFVSETEAIFRGLGKK